MLRSIAEMLVKFEENNIMYCHWKSNEHLIESLDGDTDLDMLFFSHQRDLIESILNQCNIKRFRATNHMQYNAIEDFIGFDEETSKIWHLHLHYRLTLGEKHLKGYTLPWAQFLLNNRVWNNNYGIYLSRAEDELFLLLLRISLKLRWRDLFKDLGINDNKEINWLKSKTDIYSILDVANELLDEDCSKEFERLLRMESYKKKDFLRLQSKLRKILSDFTSYSIFTSYINRTFREVLWLIGGISRRLGFNSSTPSRRISPSGGVVVAILGCDGAGKSTTLSYITREFQKKIDVKSIYLGSGDGQSSILRYPMKLVARKIGGKGIGKSIVINDQRSTNIKESFKAKLYFISKIIWAIALAFEKKKKLKSLKKARNNGMLVITDRYPQIDVMGYNDGPLLSKYQSDKRKILKKISDWEFSVYQKFYKNQPDLVIKLEVPTSVALQRKPEMTKQEIENKKRAIQKISLSSMTVKIDSSGDKNNSFRKVMARIWEII